MGWKIGDKITVDPGDNDLVLLEQGDNTRNSTFARIKKFFLGDEKLKTTAQTITGAINENTAQLADIAISIKSFGAKGNANYRKYMESYWQDSAHTTQLYKKSDGTFWTDAGFTTSYTGIVYSKPESVTYWQDSNYTIPATDDSQAFKDAFDYINTNSKTGTLFIPNGNYKCDNFKFNIDISKIKLLGGNNTKIISTGLSPNDNFVTLTFSGVWYNAYEQIKNSIENISFEGSYFQQNAESNNNVTCFYFDSNVLTPHSCIRNSSAKWFNIGMRQGIGAYKQIFDSMSFIANDIAVKFESALGSGGVPIIFSNCLFECNTLAIKNDNTGGQIHINGGSIEYNNRICDTRGAVYFNNIHFEMDMRVANNAPFRVYGDSALSKIVIRDSWVLTLENELLNVLHWIPTPIILSTTPNYMFECINTNNIGNVLLDIDNVLIGTYQKTSTRYLIGGSGSDLVKCRLNQQIDQNETYMISANSIYFDSAFDNANASLPMNFYTTYDNARNTDRLWGTNIHTVKTASGISGKSLQITKVANTGTPAQVSLFLPINRNVNGYAIKFASKLNFILPNGNISVSLIYANAELDADKVNMNFFESDTIITKTLTNNTNATNVYIYGGKPKTKLFGIIIYI